MDAIGREALTGIHQLERELVVRDFIALLNDRAHAELHPFLAENVVYRPSANKRVWGRPAVTRMIAELHEEFDQWTTHLESLAVCGDTVLTEQRLRLRLPGTSTVEVMGFASFRVAGAQISAWNQIHA
ncbi:MULTISPECIES: nuclear transport factor 2 family protein [Microbacterium]|uniref:nuclear transport factor 2 family protein n=1 Tax=Microbacterium TaxID=33882 RepID=UPI0022AFFDA3|nr:MULTISPECIES: nuclear transport factor 2 family protein [Microbacterium]MCZ4067265.1 nuclear transport factor 2 family protein [Microbacterium sp. H37-C3]WRK17745.1 nuclear transport factor 2 family protein [Microbacterium plantarum]